MGEAEYSWLQFNEDGSRLACGGRDGSLLLWDVTKRKEIAFIKTPGMGKMVSAIAFNSAGSLVAYGSNDDRGDHNVCVYSLIEGKHVGVWTDNAYGVASLSFKPQSNQLAVSGGKTVNVYDIKEPMK